MKFTLAQTEMADALNILKNAVSTKTSMEILKGIFMETKDNTLTLKSYNLDFSITMDLPCFVVEEGAAVLEYRLISEIVRKLPNEVISFTKEGDTMEVVCGNSRYELLVFDSEEYPLLPQVKEEEGIVINQSLFKEMIHLTNFATSKEESRLVLTGALLEITPGNMRMVCIDGYSVAKKDVAIDYQGEISVIVPGSMLSDLEKFIGNNLDDDMNILIKNNYIGFFFDNIKVISKVLEGNYVDYKSILPKNFTTEIKLNKNAFQQAVERTALLAIYSRSYLIKMDFTQEELILTSQSNIGESREKMNIENQGKELKIGMNPNKLLMALRVIENEEIYLKMESGNRPCLIHPVDDESYEYYIVPIRIRDGR